MESFFVELAGRGQIRVSGPDRESFLQNLVTNDVTALQSGGLVYACLLSAQGKFLHDFFMRADDNSIILDCEGGERSADLLKRLSMYKLRADVQLSAAEQVVVYAGFGPVPEGAYADPRHGDLGWRTYEKPQGLAEKPFAAWDEIRIRLCVPDGSRDLIVGNSTMDEGNMDALNAVSYEKGCYIGQELTARMHYRGLAKRRLQTINLGEATEGMDIRSRSGDFAIALMPV